MPAALARNAFFSLVSFDQPERAATGGNDVKAWRAAPPQGPFRTLRTGGSPRPPAALSRSVRTCAGDSLHFSRGVACSIANRHSTSEQKASLVPRSSEAGREGFRRALAWKWACLCVVTSRHLVPIPCVHRDRADVVPRRRGGVRPLRGERLNRDDGGRDH